MIEDVVATLLRGFTLFRGETGQLPLAVAQMVRGLSEFKAATARIDNRAVFEIPELLADRLIAAGAEAHWGAGWRGSEAPVSVSAAVSG